VDLRLDEKMAILHFIRLQILDLFLSGVMKLMIRERILLVIFIMVISVPVIHGQNTDEIVEQIYQQTLIHEAQLDSLKDYSFVQKILFTKLDGDGEIEEQSKREFIVRVHSQEVRHRELLAAFELEDGQWVDITEKEKNAGQSENKSVAFSLTEMVSPEMRNDYEFTLIGDDIVDSVKTIHLRATPLEEDEDKFTGDLWFEKDTYALIKAILIPSDFPTAIDDMVMEFTMSKFGDVWLPVTINFQAEVSFLFLFKGKIISDIVFEDYRFNQVFVDSLFGL
jgi:hypothetical protein